MKFPSPLVRARLIKRYKRFLADVELESGECLTAHIANPGAMTGLAEPGMEVWLSKSDNPKRKLAYSWELVRVGRCLVGVNAGLPNAIVEEALRGGTIRELAGYSELRREVPYGSNSRVDFVLSGGRRKPHYVEVKNVTLKQGKLAAFPDSVTARGTKHLVELASLARKGTLATMLYVVQRRDCDAFTVAGDIDPAYAAALVEARAAGVGVLCYVCAMRTTSIRLETPMRITI